MIVREANSVASEPVPTGTGVRRQMLIGPDEGPHFAMRRFRLEAGGSMPYHTNSVEHEQYVLSGRARIRVGEETVEVEAGNVLLLPADVPHSYEVLGDEAFVFLCLVPNAPDQMEILE